MKKEGVKKEGVRSNEYRVSSIGSRRFLTPYSLLLLIALAAVLWLWRGSGLFPVPDRTWQAIQERGAWRVGMDPAFPPFEMLDASGAPVGYDVDLARRMAAAWGVQLEIVAMGYDGLLDALQAGKIDSIVSAFPLDPRLTEDIAYSQPYFDAGIFLVASTQGDGPPMAGAADLAGRSVAVEWGGAGDAVGRRLQRQTTLEPTVGQTITLLPFETQEEALAALLAAQADTALVDGVTLKLAQGRGDPLAAVGPVLESNPYVIAAPITAQLLQAKIAETLAQFQAQGILAELERKWFAR